MATKVFLTGATGFIGTAIVSELLDNNYQVLGLTRSSEGVERLESMGVEVIRGELGDLDLLRDAAGRSDAVIHTAFDHDFSKFQQSCEADRAVIGALASALVGSGRALVVTSGTSVSKVEGDEVATELCPALPSSVSPRSASEEATAAAVQLGVAASIVRCSQVHDTRKQGLVSYAIGISQKQGSSAYVGDGSNRWSAVHLADTACLYRLALEKAAAGAVYHAVAEEGVLYREIAETVGKGLNMPVVSIPAPDAAGYFTWFARFVGRGNVASSTLTQQQLGWQPSGPGLIADLRAMYSL